MDDIKLKLFKLIFFVCLTLIFLDISKYINLNFIKKIFLLFTILISIIFLKQIQENFRSPLEYNFGEYNNLHLNSKNFYKRKVLMPAYNFDNDKHIDSEDCSWLRPPCNTKLHKNIYINNPNGNDELISKNPYEDQLHPPVDGKSKNYKKMFFFTYNKCSPKCCPSSYSCDKGCVCLNQDQRDYINSRGKNRIPTSKHNLNF